MLAANRINRGACDGKSDVSLLASLIYDADGELMTPSHTVKKGVRYRYYVSKSLVTGRVKVEGKGQRIPAVQIEALLTDRVRAWLADPAALLNADFCSEPDIGAQKGLLAEAAELAASWQSLDAMRVRAILSTMVRKVQVHADRVDVTIDQRAAASLLSGQPGAHDRERRLIVLKIPARLKRAGIEMKMVVEDGSEPANIDPVLVRLLVRADAIRARLFQDPSLTLREIAEEEGVANSYLSRLVRLAFLAPDIVTAILTGKHPPELTANRLMADTRLPLEWKAQREVLSS
jgi:site-specific DNA recombinase